MRKFKSALLVLIIVLGCSACADSSVDYKKQLDEANAKIKELSEEVAKSNNEKETLSKKVEQLQQKIDEAEKETTVEENDVDISFTNKINVPMDYNSGLYSNYCKFVIDITNNTDKDIKGIQGRVDIQDMFGVSIIKIQCDLTGYTIKKGETVTDDGMSFEINQFMDEANKLYNTDFKDLKFVYEVQTIMFTDGTSKSK